MADREHGVEEREDSDFSPRKMTIALACLIGSTFVPFVQATTSPFMMLPMIKDFGWTRTDYAFASTFMFVFGSITALVFGRVADRIGVRPILLAGAIFGGATMILLSFQNAELWRLHGTYALLGTFGSSGVGYTKVIGSLFTRHRGKALALFGAESTVALAILPILTNTLIADFGWRGAYVAFGLIMFCVVPIIYFAIPEPGATFPAGGKLSLAQPAAAKLSRQPPVLDGMTASEIRRDRVFWLIVLTAVLIGGLYQGLITHIVAAIVDKGFSPAAAAGAMSASTLVGLVGAFAGGFALDHFRGARVLSVFAGLLAIGVFLLGIVTASSGGLPLLIVAMAMQGAAISAMRPGLTYLLTRFLGLRAVGEANAIQVVFSGLAMAASPPLFGIIYDRAGSYAPMYWILAGGAAAAAIVYMVLGRYRYASGGGGDPSGEPSDAGAAGALAATSAQS
jgi:MFS family permease